MYFLRISLTTFSFLWLSCKDTLYGTHKVQHVFIDPFCYLSVRLPVKGRLLEIKLGAVIWYMEIFHCVCIFQGSAVYTVCVHARTTHTDSWVCTQTSVIPQLMDI